MISVQQIEKIVTEKFSGTPIYIVEVKVSAGNKIVVFFDNEIGKITLQDCVDLSRYVESKLNRDEEDFELEVSSPGMDEPFRNFKQYLKNSGREVSVITKSGMKYIGMLSEVSPEKINIETKTTEKVEGKKGRQTIINKREINFNEIKETKLVLNF